MAHILSREINEMKKITFGDFLYFKINQTYTLQNKLIKYYNIIKGIKIINIYRTRIFNTYNNIP